MSLIDADPSLERMGDNEAGPAIVKRAIRPPLSRYHCKTVSIIFNKFSSFLNDEIYRIAGKYDRGTRPVVRWKNCKESDPSVNVLLKPFFIGGGCIDDGLISFATVAAILVSQGLVFTKLDFGWDRKTELAGIGDHKRR